MFYLFVSTVPKLVEFGNTHPLSFHVLSLWGLDLVNLTKKGAGLMRSIDFVAAHRHPANITRHWRCFHASLFVKRQRFLARPSIPVVVEPDAGIERHVKVNAAARVQTRDRTTASFLRFLKDFKQLPLVTGKIKGCLGTRVDSPGEQLAATDKIGKGNEQVFPLDGTRGVHGRADHAAHN